MSIKPTYPTITTSAGYVLPIRRISPDTPGLLQAAAQRELADTKPTVPTQNVAIGPGETRDMPAPNDIDYQIAKTLWDDQVRQRAANKMLILLADYAILTPTDAEEVTSFRLMMEAQGVNLDHESDRQIWLWRILAPATEDQIAIMSFAINRAAPSEEDLAAQKATFRNNVSGA